MIPEKVTFLLFVNALLGSLGGYFAKLNNGGVPNDLQILLDILFTLTGMLLVFTPYNVMKSGGALGYGVVFLFVVFAKRGWWMYQILRRRIIDRID